ncbi:hypothetical protein N0V88_005460 [Collariella sp. IMI 366227]|nr:hypothetical protein N0V88_005460 [Collariella sp. IMI 366227]
MAAPIPLRGIPRRSRVLLFALLFVISFFLLPRLDMSINSSPIHIFGSANPEYDVLAYINPLIGTANGGLAKPVADTLSPENAAGFVSDASPITGFSHTHDSGTGGRPSLGNFPLFVHPGCPDDDFTKCAFDLKDRATERMPGGAVARPGYFHVWLKNGVTAEMTATARAALYRFWFSTTGDEWGVRGEERKEEVQFSPLVLVDMGDLMNSRTKGRIRVDRENMRVEGEGTYAPSFGSGKYQQYVCVDFKGAEIRKTGTFKGRNATEEPKILDEKYFLSMGSAGAWLQFERPEDNSIMARVGVSFVSTEQACQNAEREIPDFSFERAESEAREAWRKKLGAIEVDPTGVSEELLTTFWSGLYRTMLSPQNYTGENPLWQSSEPYYDSFYCIWDSFRAQHPLLTIIDPVAQTEMIRALIDIYRHEGKLPDCRMSFCKGYTQGGSNADVVIADAFIKNLTADINWDDAYAAVISDAEGRGNLVAWHEHGYIPTDDTDRNGTGPASRTISRGLEYAYNDFCISRLAAGLNHTADAAKYHLRGGNWRNYWNPSQPDISPGVFDPPSPPTSPPPTPLHSPSRASCNRASPTAPSPQSPRSCSPLLDTHSCYYDTTLHTYEGSPWLYSFYAPHSMSTLISLMGGPAAFTSRLTYFLTASGLSYMGNEQAFLTTFLFHYAGRPGLSSALVREYIPALFNETL